MMFFLFSIVLGLVLGFVIKTHRAKKDALSLFHTIQTLEQEVSSLRHHIHILKRDAAHQKEKHHNANKEAFAKWRNKKRKEAENDLSTTNNQKRFIAQCSLYAKAPINRECAKAVLYHLEEWVARYHPQWRVAFEVSMGAFIKTVATPNSPLADQAFHSYNSKRVDFLLIDQIGNPQLVIEYNGSGHDPDGTAGERMAVKKLALRKAKIPLLEIDPDTPRQKLHALLTAYCT